MRIHHIHRPAFVLCIVLCASAAFAQSSLPSNLRMAPMYRELVESIADRSATFRHQLMRIASEPRLTIDLAFVPRIVGARAKTLIVRQMDELDARIQVDRLDDVIELIAHEIEHVIEQMDGVNLAAASAVGNVGIYSVSPSGMVFETERAVRVGVSVAHEVRASPRRED